MQSVAETLASDSEWPPLFDTQQLLKNEVPVYAALYEEDLYVDADLSRQTAQTIKGCRFFSTNGLLHNAVRAKSEEVVGKLFALRDDVGDWC